MALKIHFWNPNGGVFCAMGTTHWITKYTAEILYFTALIIKYSLMEYSCLLGIF